MNRTRTTLFSTLCLGLSALALCGAAFHNGFPLVHSDTGTYVDSGFALFVPDDRPIFYGLFLRAASLSLSLWGPVAVQALLAAWLIRRAVAVALELRGARLALVALLLVLFLALATNLSSVTSFLLPDLFAALGLLALGLLLAPGVQGRGTLAASGAVVVLSALVHSSHLVTATLLLLLLAALRRSLPARLGVALGLLAASWLLLPISSWLASREFVVTRGSHVFLAGRLAESGLLQQYLDEKCGRVHYRLCDERGAIPRSAIAFIWGGEASPLSRIGGFRGSRAELNAILRGMLSDPRYLALNVAESLRATGQLLAAFDLPELPAQPPEGEVWQRIAARYPGAQAAWAASREAHEALPAPRLSNRVQQVTVGLAVLCLGLICCLPALRRTRTPAQLWLSLWLAGGVLLNAWTCATLASPADPRYQNRVAWLLPLAALLLLVRVRSRTSSRALPG